MSAIEFEHVSFQDNPEQRLVQDVSFSIAKGDCALLLGRNGAGKSTTLKLMNGICKPGAGSIRINGRTTVATATSELAREIAVTFQHPSNQIFSSSVRTELSFGPKNLHRDRVDEIVEEAADTCGITSLLDKHPYDLSYAARKLVTIASAVAMQSPILAFDEPSAGMSGPELQTLLSLFASLKRQGRTILVITHDPDVFLPFADKVLVLQSGVLRFDGVPEEFLQAQRRLRRYGADLPLRMRLEHMAEEYGG